MIDDLIAEVNNKKWDCLRMPLMRMSGMSMTELRLLEYTYRGQDKFIENFKNADTHFFTVSRYMAGLEAYIIKEKLKAKTEK